MLFFLFATVFNLPEKNKLHDVNNRGRMEKTEGNEKKNTGSEKEK